MLAIVEYNNQVQLIVEGPGRGKNNNFKNKTLL